MRRAYDEGMRMVYRRAQTVPPQEFGPDPVVLAHQLRMAHKEINLLREELKDARRRERLNIEQLTVYTARSGTGRKFHLSEQCGSGDGLRTSQTLCLTCARRL